MGGPHRTPGGASGGRDGRSGLALPVLTSPAGAAHAPPDRACAASQPGYPPALAALSDPPARVYLRGADPPPLAGCVAIVGSRAASPYGLAMASRLARDLAGVGLAVVSGLARGIDAAAHRGALAGGGATVAVVPAGLDAVHGVDHAGLADEIAATGTLLTEVASGPPFGRAAFVLRNRLIAGLSAVTVVVEAAERSGALSTAAAARRLGRPLLAVPGDVDRPTALGTLRLLREGARPCGALPDVLAVMPARPSAGPLPPEARVLAALDGEPRTVDELAARAALPPHEAAALLLRLAWSGSAEVAGGRWRRPAGGAA